MILRRSAAGIVLYAYGAAAECAGCTKKLFEPTCDGFSKKTARWGNWYERHVPVPQSTLAPTTSPAPTASSPSQRFRARRPFFARSDCGIL